MDTYSGSLCEKTAEITRLQKENEELRAEIRAREVADEAAEVRATTNVRPPPQPRIRTTTTYAETVMLDPKPGQQKVKNTKNSSRSTKKKTLEKCREVKTTSRLTIEVPSGVTVASAKAELWATVKGKMNNPRAKTVIRDQQITIIPDDSKTFEVISKLPNVKVLEPKKPRVIIYDVDSELTDGEVTTGLVNQNPELGLTQEDVNRLVFKHRLGPRNGTTTHLVLEAHASTLPKLEGKQVFLGLTRCRIKLHQTLPQCYNCQQYGHTALRCEQKSPTCRNCAGAHDSRTCNVELVKCANCKGPHKASSGVCKAKGQAKRSLLRRTDFGSR